MEASLLVAVKPSRGRLFCDYKQGASSNSNGIQNDKEQEEGAPFSNALLQGTAKSLVWVRTERRALKERVLRVHQPKPKL